MAKILVHNVETGEVIERPLTEDEIDQIKKDELAAQAKIELAAKAEAAKEAAQAKLAALGLTPDDLAALGL